jgi:hypothetical protein
METSENAPAPPVAAGGAGGAAESTDTVASAAIAKNVPLKLPGALTGDEWADELSVYKRTKQYHPQPTHLVDHKHKLICTVWAKCACTTLRAVFHELWTGEDATELGHEKLHDMYSVRNTSTEGLDWNVTTRRLQTDPTLAGYYRFSVVRRPWERAVSWYRDKILGRHISGGDSSTLVAVAHFGAAHVINIQSKTRLEASFEAIVAELFLSRLGRFTQQHLAPIIFPEGVRYDEVFEMRDLDRRLPEILKNAGAPKTPSVGARRNATGYAREPLPPSYYVGDCSPISGAIRDFGSPPPARHFMSEVLLALTNDIYADELDRLEYAPGQERTFPTGWHRDFSITGLARLGIDFPRGKLWSQAEVLLRATRV